MESQGLMAAEELAAMAKEMQQTYLLLDEFEGVSYRTIGAMLREWRQGIMRVLAMLRTEVGPRDDSENSGKT